jgi:hypothetical protein
MRSGEGKRDLNIITFSYFFSTFVSAIIMKNVVLLFFLFLSVNLWGQVNVGDLGLYNELDFYRHKSPQLIDVQAWIHLDSLLNGLYMEVRHGYEDSSSSAIVIGDEIGFFKDNLIFTPMAGYVFGKTLDGVSICANFEYELGGFGAESDNEYFQSNNRPGEKNFFYDWSKLYKYFRNEEAGTNFGLGAGLQFQCISQHILWAGPMIRFKICKLISLDIFDYYNCLSLTSYDRWIYTFAVDINDN